MTIGAQPTGLELEPTRPESNSSCSALLPAAKAQGVVQKQAPATGETEHGTREHHGQQCYGWGWAFWRHKMHSRSVHVGTGEVAEKLWLPLVGKKQVTHRGNTPPTPPK